LTLWEDSSRKGIRKEEVSKINTFTAWYVRSGGYSQKSTFPEQNVGFHPSQNSNHQSVVS